MNRVHRDMHAYAFSAVVASFAWAGSVRAAPDFDPYGVILERKPFGEEFVAAPSSLPNVPPEKSVVNQIRMSAVIRDNAGVLRVGLVDLKTKQNAMLGIGESMNEIEVVEADYGAERARLRRGPEDYWVSMLGGSNRFEKVTAPVPEPVRALAAPSPPVDQKLSYARRRQQRESARLRVELERLRALETEKAKTAAAPRESPAAAAGMIRAGRKRAGEHNMETALSATFSETNRLDLSEEEIAQMLQEYQKELLRSGQTPLPIPLSPETDRQLVEEGILPAQE